MRNNSCGDQTIWSTVEIAQRWQLMRLHVWWTIWRIQFDRMNTKWLPQSCLAAWNVQILSIFRNHFYYLFKLNINHYLDIHSENNAWSSQWTIITCDCVSRFINNNKNGEISWENKLKFGHLSKDWMWSSKYTYVINKHAIVRQTYPYVFYVWTKRREK